MSGGADEEMRSGEPRATVGPASPDALGGPDAGVPSVPGPGAGRRWSLSDLLWLLDGDWSVSSVADRVVASREGVAVVVTRDRGVYRAVTRLRGVEYNCHQSATLPGVLAGVRRDLRREGV